MKKKVLMIHLEDGNVASGQWEIIIDWQNLLRFRLRAHKQASTSSKTDSLLVPDTKIIIEADDLSDLSAATVGRPTPNSECLKGSPNCTHLVITEVIINSKSVYLVLTTFQALWQVLYSHHTI